jgi:translation initiation factor IF-1
MSSDPMTPAQTVEGKVEAYTAGKSITVVKKDGSTATFTIPDKLKVTDNITVGSKVTIRTNATKPTTVETITVLPPQ